MINKLRKFLQTKKHFVFDFDRTLARMEMDWSGWHTGISEVYAKYDPDHGYRRGKNPHLYHNKLVAKHGDSLLDEARKFNREYEAKHLTGFTPNHELIQFIISNSAPTHYVYSSNARPTVIRGLTELGILNHIKAMVTKDDVRFIKPDPEGFSLFENYADNKHHFLMVGDSHVDQEAAASAGVDFLECDKFTKQVDEG